MTVELYNLASVNSRDCPRCFRVGALAGPRIERATLECTGCAARFVLERSPGGELDTLRRLFLPRIEGSAGIVCWPLVLLVAILLGACSGPAAIRGSGERISPPEGWTEYCAHEPTDPACQAKP